LQVAGSRFQVAGYFLTEGQLSGTGANFLGRCLEYSIFCLLLRSQN
jgi:hypothetical protein